MAERIVATTKVPETKQKSQNSCKQNSALHSSEPFVNRIIQLQRTAGNQAVQRLIKSRTLQAKLKIGQPNDVYEQEADRVADQVTKMPELSGVGKMGPHRENTSIQRKYPKLERYEKKLKLYGEMQRKSLKNIHKVKENKDPEVTPGLEQEINSMNGGGHPLPDPVLSFLEPRFGYNFNPVRIHTDNRADNLSRSVNALAFTVGNNVFFRSGAYNPISKDGLHLLTHELTHTVQQTGNIKTKPLSNFTNVQMKHVDEAKNLQRLVKTMSTSEIIQRRVVCDEWGENCQSIPDQEEAPSTGQQGYTSSDSSASEYNNEGAGGAGGMARGGGFEGGTPEP